MKTRKYQANFLEAAMVRALFVDEGWIARLVCRTRTLDVTPDVCFTEDSKARFGPEELNKFCKSMAQRKMFA